MENKKLLVGTTKGLVVFERSEKGWDVEALHFLGMPASLVYVDEHQGRWWVCLAHWHWGQKIQYSDDQGKTWQSTPTPAYPAEAVMQNGKPASLKRIWAFQQAGTPHPDDLWIGTEPGGLFLRSNDKDSPRFMEGLWDHPSRKDENQWFGTGRRQPFLHSIVVDPRDNQHIYIAVSCAGVFESRDGGTSWEPRNKGLIAAYLPNPKVEVGHDPHMMFACKSNPDVLWQQNHCGIFRSSNGGFEWDNVSDANGLANYGFALAIDHQNPERAWVIPAVSDEIRVAVDLALCVCRTEDGGKSWEPLRKGLPQSNSFDIVFRHALAIDGNCLAFGTTTGNLYLSEDFGESWQCLSHNLARTDCVTFA